jgi:hypothetical protein
MYTDVVARVAVPPSRTLGGGPVETITARMRRSRHELFLGGDPAGALRRCGSFRGDYRCAGNMRQARLSCTRPLFFGRGAELIGVADHGRLQATTDHLRRAAGLGTLCEFRALRRWARYPLPGSTMRGASSSTSVDGGRCLALAGERAAALRLLAKVPLAAHTWRDHARVWRRVLLPASRGREPSTR